MPEGPRGFYVRSRSWNIELDLRTAIQFSPDRELTAYEFRAFPHPRQAVVPLTAVSAEHVGGNSFPVIPNAEPEVLFVVTDFHFDVLCRRVPERIAQRLHHKPVNLISQDRMQTARCSFHNQVEVGRGLNARSRSQFFPNRPNGYRKIILLDRRNAQALHRIPALGDRLRRMIRSSLKHFTSVSRTCR